MEETPPKEKVQIKPGGPPQRQNPLDALKELKALEEAGTITKADFELKKKAIVDKVTGTRQNLERKKERRKKSPTKQKYIVPKAPPDFSTLPSENALLHEFDVKAGTWSHTQRKVKIEENPFAKGSLRLAYHMVLDDDKTNFVAKISIDPFEERESYFQDVTTQMYAREYAKQYNTYNPPKRVDFVAAYLLELSDRPNRPLCTVEQFISGPYRKYNSNYGFVSEDERNTPQAFAHFTYEASKRQVLICDIQGVGDMYTDPQIHSIDSQGFGKGNMGRRGFEKFLATHQCNAICRYFKLALINVKSRDLGTVPNIPYMPHPHVEVVNLRYDMLSVDPFRDPPAPLAPLIASSGLSTTRCHCIIL